MYDNNMSGVLFRNDKKEAGSKQPDYRGKLEINGIEYELAAWIREAKGSGNKFMSLKVSVKNDQYQPPPDDMDTPF